MLRSATMDDVKIIHGLLKHYADQGLLLPRSISSIYDKLRDFVVYELDGKVVGVCALQIFWEDLAEIRSLAVDESCLRGGIGRLLVENCLQEARNFRISRVFTLTYQTEFFRKLGFYDIDKKELPHKIWSDCLHCPNFPECDENALMFDNM